MTSRTRSARRILGDLKKSVSGVENWTPKEKGRLSGLAEARRICALRAPHEMVGGGADGKARIERMCISLPFVETFNSKVIKGFVSELRSCKCFSCFEILWSMYICYEHSMSISHISGYLAMLHSDLSSIDLLKVHWFRPLAQCKGSVLIFRGLSQLLHAIDIC